MATKFISKNQKHGLLLFALCNLLLSPIWVSVIGSDRIVVSINYTILILAGFLLNDSHRKQSLGLILGVIAVSMIWAEGFNASSVMWTCARSFFTFSFIIIICIILVREIVAADEVDIHLIMDAISGFLLFGILGGILFEVLDLLQPGSLVSDMTISGYIYYYYSFITITSVGYGDVLPANQSAYALALLLSIFGQFYMAIVVAVFVGKYLSEGRRGSKNKDE